MIKATVFIRVAQEQEQEQDQEQEQEQKQEQMQEQKQNPGGVKTGTLLQTYGICNGSRSSFASAPTQAGASLNE